MKMSSVNFLILVIIVASVKAAPLYVDYSYDSDPVPYPAQDAIELDGNFYHITKPIEACVSGLVLNGDLNFNLSFFAGEEKTSSNVLQALERKIQSVSNGNESHNGGLFEELVSSFKGEKLNNLNQLDQLDQLPRMEETS